MEENIIEGVGPVSETTKQVLEDLQKQGMSLGEGTEVDEIGEIVDKKPVEKIEAVVEKTEVVEETKEVKPDEKIDRKPSLTPTWKLKMEEKRWEKEKEEMKSDFDNQMSTLQKKVEELSSDKNMSASEKSEITDEIESIANEFGLDDANRSLIKKLEKAILSKVKIPDNISKKVEELENEKLILAQQKQFDSEYSGDILPFINEKYPNITKDSLSEIKSKLEELAYDERYLRIPLKKIFKAEMDDFSFSENPNKQGVESGKSGQNRSEAIDFDRMDEDTFSKLTPDQQLEFSKQMAKKDGGWN